MAPLIQLSNYTLSVGANLLLDGVSAQIIEGQRIALVGPNGCGKSTLLRALGRPGPGATEYFLVGGGHIAGQVSAADWPEGATLLVEQDDLQWAQLLPTAECSEEELRTMTLPEALDMAAASGDDSAVEDIDTWRRLSVAAHSALGWSTAAYDRTPLGQLSPGCAVRAYLAVALHRVDVKLLLLDEPTNHLDIPSILWLQQTILASGKAVVMVSHDHAFLDAVADHIWDVDASRHSLTVSGAQFSAYVHAKEVAREKQRAAYEQQQDRHRQLSGVAEKLRAASEKGAQHQSRDHDLLQRDFKRDRAGRSGRKAKAIETRRDAEPTVERVVDRAPLRIILPDVKRGVDSSITLGDAVLGWDGRALPLTPLSLRIDFGERVAIVGFNGVGKSTLLKTLTGAIEPIEGSVHVGRELRVGNLTQEHETLPREETPRSHVAALTGMPPFEAGVRLIQYGLTRQQVDWSIGQLNPGARARTLLAIFSLRQVNALILDEPTNHLDDEAVSEVASTLNDYKGTVVVVSHSRDFLATLQLTRTLRLTPGGLTEVESLEEFVSATEEAVRQVVAAAAGSQRRSQRRESDD